MSFFDQEDIVNIAVMSMAYPALRKWVKIETSLNPSIPISSSWLAPKSHED